MSTTTNADEVNTSNLNVSNEFVCLIDIMGTSNTMSESFEKSANHILRFHNAVIQAIENYKVSQKVERDTVIFHYYPIMDGIYITCDDFHAIKSLIGMIFRSVSNFFIKEDNPNERFIIRGAIAYGQIFHICEMSEMNCPVLYKFDKNYMHNLMIGMPMIKAHESENEAPPFALYIHESARLKGAFQGKYMFNIYNNIENLSQKLNTHFHWCIDHYKYINISKEKIENYMELDKEYFDLCMHFSTNRKGEKRCDNSRNLQKNRK